MYRKLFLVTAGLAAFTACDDGGFGDTGDTGFTDDGGPLLIYSVTNDCDANNWYYTVLADGATTDGLIDVDQNTEPAWSEQHTLVSVAWDGQTDQLEQVLSIVTDYRDQVADQSTLFECSDSMIGSMAWRATIYDLDGNQADCVVWGNQGAIDDVYGSSCENANNW